MNHFFPAWRLVTALALFAHLSAPTLADDPAAEWEARTARFQSTYVWQGKRPFAAAYSGANSLKAGGERSYTFTATAYLGLRPWAGGEAYFNPELTQGVPFSDLTGMGSFTNGEITRAAGTTPKVYRQRLFLRQTWNQGGGEERVAGDMNRMAGAVDRDRVVLAAGNFSTLDVFDNNAYAKDPRTQFMNWGNMTYAAYDYAADARGFGWGAALEWYRQDWVFRVGRMTGPRQPNMLPVDPALGRHYGDQVEIERGYEIAGRPGKLRLLAWRNRARVARYDDALAWLRAHPADAQAILMVRNAEQIKYGLGVNVEQELSGDVGFFLRAMKADGRSETWAFTEVDASLAAGLSVRGAAWGRAQDAAGFAVMRNTLSRDRRDYLAAGGISFFIGDGALAYRPETIFEAYYRWNLARHVDLSVDWQHYRNPAYNADRGPVNIHSLRLHAEF